MERWQGKIAVVTGASSGIGWAICKELLQAHVNVFGLARRQNVMENFKSELPKNQAELFFPIECDITAVDSVRKAFECIEEKFSGRVHILINNAGMCEFSRILAEGNDESLKRVIDVNLMGAVYCTKQAYRLMKNSMEQHNEECYVINVNSLLGHRVPIHIPSSGFNLYPVAKHAMRTLNEMLRREMFDDKLMRLSTISPGLTETNFTNAGDFPELPDFGKILQPEDISRGVVFMLATPAHVTVAELVMVPSGEKY